MSYLILVVVFLAASVLALDTNFVQKELGGALPSSPHHQRDPLAVFMWDDPTTHPNNKWDDRERRVNSQSRIKYTSFERQVTRLLRKFGLLNADYTAERVVESLRKDKDLLRNLKKLLDEVDEEEESEDLGQYLIDLIFS